MGHVDGGVKALFHIVLRSCLNPYFHAGPFSLMNSRLRAGYGLKMLLKHYYSGPVYAGLNFKLTALSRLSSFAS